MLTQSFIVACSSPMPRRRASNVARKYRTSQMLRQARDAGSLVPWKHFGPTSKFGRATDRTMAWFGGSAWKPTIFLRLPLNFGGASWCALKLSYTERKLTSAAVVGIDRPSGSFPPSAVSAPINIPLHSGVEAARWGACVSCRATGGLPPQTTKRACHAHTIGFYMRDRHIISATITRMIFARPTCFSDAPRSATIASSLRQSCSHLTETLSRSSCELY